jgi:hypothetical protein
LENLLTPLDLFTGRAILPPSGQGNQIGEANGAIDYVASRRIEEWSHSKIRSAGGEAPNHAAGKIPV